MNPRLGATVRQDFPILRQEIRGKPLVYLDSAATTQKPRQVIEAIGRYYETENANVHRGVHTLSERATASYEGARTKVRKFLNAADDREIVFVRGTTEAINLVAQTFGRSKLNVGDAVAITAMEHHSNIVPWQMVCQERGAQLRVAPIDERGDLRLDALERLLTPEVKLLSLVHVSNALGTVNPIRRICELAHAKGIPVLVDGAQAVSHLPVDVRALGCDFYAISAHKMFGPTGIGALYGRAEVMEALPPYMGGGDMILSVTFEKTLYNRLPYRFEAGTPDIAGAIGFGAAVDYIEGVGRAEIAAYEHDLLEYATAAVEAVPGLRLIGKAKERASVLSFILRDGEIHPHDIGTVLDQEGIAIRTGHHCAQPLMQVYGVAATARASLALYNTREDVDALVRGLRKVLEVLG
ncbi:MAG TPA: cysteine desulfurase [Myxococcaceae bacterium]|nr:cysteine desulfurase [Myxococcaceae bacterium]